MGWASMGDPGFKREMLIDVGRNVGTPAKVVERDQSVEGVTDDREGQAFSPGFLPNPVAYGPCWEMIVSFIYQTLKCLIDASCPGPGDGDEEQFWRTHIIRFL